jgi:hypothetical protein
MAKSKLSRVLAKGWADFSEALGDLTETELEELLDKELNGKNRPSYVERIHSRFNSRRLEREKRELAEKADG